MKRQDKVRLQNELSSVQAGKLSRCSAVAVLSEGDFPCSRPHNHVGRHLSGNPEDYVSWVFQNEPWKAIFPKETPTLTITEFHAAAARVGR